jgi:hypothetical protein
MRGYNTLAVGSVLGMLLAFALGLSLLHITQSSLYYSIPCFSRNDGRRNSLTTFSVTVTDLYFHLGDAARRLRWPLGRGLSPGRQRSPPSRLIDATRAGADAVSGSPISAPTWSRSCCTCTPPSRRKSAR